jgi:hypothetical protein
MIVRAEMYTQKMRVPKALSKGDRGYTTYFLIVRAQSRTQKMIVPKALSKRRQELNNVLSESEGSNTRLKNDSAKSII